MTSLSRVRRRLSGLLWCAVMPIALLAGGCGSGTGSPVDASSPVDATMNTSDVAQVLADAASDAAQPGADGGACLPPARVSYPNPGCGASAVRVCSSEQVLDSCAAIRFYCGCDGKTTVTGGCGWSNEPYLYAGACPDGGVTGDGP
jgi:hypothetical protein